MKAISELEASLGRGVSSALEINFWQLSHVSGSYPLLEKHTSCLAQRWLYFLQELLQSAQSIIPTNKRTHKIMPDQKHNEKNEFNY